MFPLFFFPSARSPRVDLRFPARDAYRDLEHTCTCAHACMHVVCTCVPPVYRVCVCAHPRYLSRRVAGVSDGGGAADSRAS